MVDPPVYNGFDESLAFKHLWDCNSHKEVPGIFPGCWMVVLDCKEPMVRPYIKSVDLDSQASGVGKQSVSYRRL